MNALHCEQFVELVTGFLDGTLDADTERSFVEHAGLCEGCDRYLDQIARVIRTLRRL